MRSAVAAPCKGEPTEQLQRRHRRDRHAERRRDDSRTAACSRKPAPGANSADGFSRRQGYDSGGRPIAANNATGPDRTTTHESASDSPPRRRRRSTFPLAPLHRLQRRASPELSGRSDRMSNDRSARASHDHDLPRRCDQARLPAAPHARQPEHGRLVSSALAQRRNSRRRPHIPRSIVRRPLWLGLYKGSRASDGFNAFDPFAYIPYWGICQFHDSAISDGLKIAPSSSAPAATPHA